MAKLKGPAGDLNAMRSKECGTFFTKNFKDCGPFNGHGPMVMNKPLIARSDAVVGSMPKGGDTTGGAVGGLKDSSDYQGKRAGMPPRSK